MSNRPMGERITALEEGRDRHREAIDQINKRDDAQDVRLNGHDEQFRTQEKARLIWRFGGLALITGLGAATPTGGEVLAKLVSLAFGGP